MLPERVRGAGLPPQLGGSHESQRSDDLRVEHGPRLLLGGADHREAMQCRRDGGSVSPGLGGGGSYRRQLGRILLRRDHRGGVPPVAVASGQLQHARTVPGDPDLRHFSARGFQIHPGALQPIVLAAEGDRPLRRQTQADDLQGLLQAGDRFGGVQPVRVDVHPLASTDAQDGCALGEVRQRHHRLCDQDGMTPDRLGHPDAEAHPPDAGCEVAEQNLIVEKLMRSRALRSKPGQLLVPDGTGKDVLKVVDDHHRVQPHRPSPELKRPAGRSVAAACRFEAPRRFPKSS